MKKFLLAVLSFCCARQMSAQTAPLVSSSIRYGASVASYQKPNLLPASGFVGINTGTAIPEAPLHVVGRWYASTFPAIFPGAVRPSNGNMVGLIRLELYNGNPSLPGQLPNGTPLPGSKWEIGLTTSNNNFLSVNSQTTNSLAFLPISGGQATAVFQTNGNLLIAGKLIAPEVFVTTTIPWADYVFKPTYRLRPLSEVNSFVRTYGHLPGVPSACEVEDNGGFNVGHMSVLFLEKIEELTLYSIQQDELVRTQQERIEKLEQRLQALEQRLAATPQTH
jgi:hypothetical protein